MEQGEITRIEQLDGLLDVQLLGVARESDKETIQNFIAGHSNPIVRGALLANPNLHSAVLEKLKGDQNPHIRSLLEIRSSDLEPSEQQAELDRIIEGFRRQLSGDND